MRFASALLLAAALGGCASDVPPDVFIAFGEDFEDYPTWTSFDRGVDPIPPSHEAASFLYVDPMPPSGSPEFPVGTRIVREQRVGEDPAGWVLHAMVKRGGGFNADGAPGWEFFGLALADDGRPFIAWRGTGPADGDGYTAPDGGEVLSCNQCHGSATYNDSVLSPVLDLTALP
ncbi:MAG: hypothetical protein H6719_05400 [Sandaracinaceae bacterium]|nr:hypothetical protein [Sandaracinaceae bacterium]